MPRAGSFTLVAAPEISNGVSLIGFPFVAAWLVHLELYRRAFWGLNPVGVQVLNALGLRVLPAAGAGSILVLGDQGFYTDVLPYSGCSTSETRGSLRCLSLRLLESVCRGRYIDSRRV